jgi:hypothetical protein
VGKTVAGGNGCGYALNQLCNPVGLIVDSTNGDALIVVEFGNGRVVRWQQGATTGILVAGGNGCGTQSNQLCYPQYGALDNNGTLFIDDNGNQRIQRWNKGTTSGTTILSNVAPHGVTFDKQEQHMYVAYYQQHYVLKFNKDGSSRQIVAGGRGEGDWLQQLNYHEFNTL